MKGELNRKKIIHKATDYFGITYYGFLALYALYELFLGGKYLSPIVVEPLSYMLLFLGLLLFLVAPFYVFATFRDKDIKLFFREVLIYLFGGPLIAAGAVVLVLRYIDPQEQPGILGANSWIFALIALAEVSIRNLVIENEDSQEEKKFVRVLDRISYSNREAWITFGVLCWGFLSIPMVYIGLDATDIRGIFFLLCSRFILFGIPLAIFIGWISIELGRIFPVGHITGEVAVPKVKNSQRSSEDNIKPLSLWGWIHLLASMPHGVGNKKPRLWSEGMSLFLTIPSTILIYLALVYLSGLYPAEKLFILVISLTYVLLAFFRWQDIKEIRRSSAEALS